MKTHSTSHGKSLAPARARVLRALGSVDLGTMQCKEYRAAVRQDGLQWQERGARKAFALCKTGAKNVPAYAHFLRKNGVHIESMTLKDFPKIPITTKENYIQAYSLKERSWNGDMRAHRLLAVSSGTSGEPTIWPRGESQEAAARFIHEFLYTELFDIDRHTTLLIIGFPMGVYVSGIATALPSFAVSLSHPHLTIATVGNNKEGVLKIVEAQGSAYEQVVLVGHPFFLKDVLETGISRGISWKSLHTRMLSCSEGFNETWRTYVSKLVKDIPERSFFGTYGSSEFLLVGFENPYSIRIRQEAEANREVAQVLFGTHEVPNLFQYNPLLHFIETAGTDLVITATAGIPLFRFNQHDAGSVISYDIIQKNLRDLHKAISAGSWKSWHLPFVTLSGRSDRTLVFYAANIYSEHIEQALGSKDLIPLLTGKFLMRKRYATNKDQYMEIMVELREGCALSSALALKIQKAVVKTLETVNMEYLFLRNHLDKDIVPRIVLRLYQDPTYFKPGTKPRFIEH